jgi:molecular chaperone IbpA
MPVRISTHFRAAGQMTANHKLSLEKEKQMTRLQRELDSIIETLLYPSRHTTTYAKSGPSYPPYNIIRLSDTETVLEVAIAGFKENEVNVVVENEKLKISGKKEVADSSNYLYKGIGTRAFERSFAISKDTKVTRAEYADGVLSIFMHYEVPEEKKPKQIPVQRAEKVYLTE